MRKVTFPRMGYYTEAFEYLIKEIGCEPIVPPTTTQETIKLGVRHSSDMVCFPFKVSLGNLIQGLDKGADTIVAIGLPAKTIKFNLNPMCRFTYYYYVQEQILRRLGYKFDMFYIRYGIIKPFQCIKQINPNVSYLKIIKIANRFLKKIKEIEQTYYNFERKDINIGLVGEIFTLLEPAINYDIVNKLKKMGVGTHLSINLSWFLHHHNTKNYKELKKYFPDRIGGHGYESLYNTLWYAKNNFDGVIHLLPLSCMPETMVEMVMNMIGEDYKIPIYRFPIDENRFEVGFNTRIETFIKLLRKNKNETLYGN